MDKITFCEKIDGIMVEQLIRYGQFNMKVKHFHNQYELFYIIEGERHFFFDNRQYIAKAGDLVLIDTNLIHMTKSIPATDGGYNRVIIYIDFDKMADFDKKYPSLGLIRFFHEHYGCFHLTKEQQDSFRIFYRELRDILTEKDMNYQTGAELAILSWLYKITTQLAKQDTTIMPLLATGAYKTVYAVADYLTDHCEQNITLDALADQFYLSKYYLCRVFKEITTYTVTEYVNIHRIRKATALLENTTQSISEIADSLGFESLTYFEKKFKQYMQTSPLRYRKNKNSIPIAEETVTVFDDSALLDKNSL